MFQNHAKAASIAVRVGDVFLMRNEEVLEWFIDHLQKDYGLKNQNHRHQGSAGTECSFILGGASVLPIRSEQERKRDSLEGSLECACGLLLNCSVCFVCCSILRFLPSRLDCNSWEGVVMGDVVQVS